MTGPSFNRRRLFVDCAVVLAAHAILLQVMAHTRLIERVMAMQFNAVELAVIGAFLLARFLAYFVVPPTLVALLVAELIRRWPRRGS